MLLFHIPKTNTLKVESPARSPRREGLRYKILHEPQNTAGRSRFKLPSVTVRSGEEVHDSAHGYC